MKKKIWLVATVLICMTVFLCGCNAQRDASFFGTQIIIKIDMQNANKAIDSVFEELSRLDNLFSPTTEGSDVWKINQAKAGEQIVVSKDTINCLKESKQLFEETNGAFDPSVYPLVKLWKFSGDTYTGLNQLYTPPTREEILATLPFVGLEKIVFDENVCIVTKTNTNTQIDFGAVAKGYALGKSMKMLENAKWGLLNFGGNIGAIKETFNVEIRHPRATADKFSIGKFALLAGESASTSGDYERKYIKYDEEKNETMRFHHIINPKTGYPVGVSADGEKMIDGRLISVSVVSDEYARCDAYSTAIFVLGAEKGMEFAKSKKIKCLMVDNNFNVNKTDNFEISLF